MILSYETADGGRQSTVRSQLSIERVRQGYKEIEQLQKEMDEVKERLKAATKEH